MKSMMWTLHIDKSAVHVKKKQLKRWGEKACEFVVSVFRSLYVLHLAVIFVFTMH